MKAKIIAFHNNKGGVLKTTLSVNMAGALAQQGNKVLLFDLDPQGNALLSFRKSPHELEKTIYDVFFDNAKAEDVIVNVFDNLDVLPANKDMYGFDYMVATEGYNVKLDDILATLVGKYDYIFIDTSPSQSFATLGALFNAEAIIVPFVADTFGVNGIKVIRDFIEAKVLKQNKALKKVLVVPTIFVSNNKDQADVITQVEKYLEDTKLFKLSKARVKRSVAFQKSILTNKLPLVLASKAKGGARAPIYSLAREIKEL